MSLIKKVATVFMQVVAGLVLLGAVASITVVAPTYMFRSADAEPHECRERTADVLLHMD